MEKEEYRTYFGNSGFQQIIERSRLSAEEFVNFLSDYEFREFNKELGKWLELKEISEEEFKRTFMDLSSNIEDKEEREKRRDGWRRNVANWLKGDRMPDRSNLFLICLALNLSLKEAEEFLTKAAQENWLHFNEASELIFFYCLKNKIKIIDYIKLLVNYKILICDTTGISDTSNYTMRNAKEIPNIESENDLDNFLNQNAEYFNQISVTRLNIFKDMIDKIRPDGFPDDTKESFETIKEEEFQLSVPLNRKTSELTPFQRNIKKYWPNSTSIDDMYNGRENASRTALIIAFLAANPDACESQDIERIRDEIDDMLSECNMPLLDPRREKDAIILKALLSMDEEAFIHEEISKIINVIFKRPQKI